MYFCNRKRQSYKSVFYDKPYRNRQFWCRGYYVDTVGKNSKRIEEYVKNQIQEDIVEDNISKKEYVDPFAERGNK